MAGGSRTKALQKVSQWVSRADSARQPQTVAVGLYVSCVCMWRGACVLCALLWVWQLYRCGDGGVRCADMDDQVIPYMCAFNDAFDERLQKYVGHCVQSGAASRRSDGEFQHKCLGITANHSVVVGVGQRRKGCREIQCYRGPLLVSKTVIDCNADGQANGNSVRIHPTPLSVIAAYPVHVVSAESGDDDFFRRRGCVRLSVLFALLDCVCRKHVAWVECEDDKLAYDMFRLFPCGTSDEDADMSCSTYYESLEDYRDTGNPITTFRGFVDWSHLWKERNEDESVTYRVYPTDDNRRTIMAAIDEWTRTHVSSASNKDFKARFIYGPTHEDCESSAELRQCFPEHADALSGGLLPTKRVRS